MRRQINALSDREFDLVVVGGGIFGICAAWDAAQRGLSVALIEQGDFAHAASANCFKMVHGGVRYLQHMDLPRLRQSSRERNILLRIAPHMVRPLPILTPTYGHGLTGKELMGAALRVYDALAWDRNSGIRETARMLPPGHLLSRRETLERFPGLRDAGLNGAAVLYDAQMYSPARLALAFLRRAADAGGTVANYVAAEHFLRRDGRVVGVRARDLVGDQSFDVRAKVVLNAAGAWAEPLLARDRELAVARPAMFSRDACFVVRRRMPSEMALAVPARTKDPDALLSRGARHLFVVPWREHTLVGVWHVVHGGAPDHVDLAQSELRDYVDEINEVYPGIDITLDDVSLSMYGLVLFGHNEPGAHNLSYGKRSRLIDHEIESDVPGLITLLGVRYTTARAEAERAVNLTFKKLGHMPPACLTSDMPVHGGAIEDFSKFESQAMATRPAGVSEATMTGLLKNHGSAYDEVLALGRAHPEWMRTVNGTGVLQAEVVHAVRKEMAQTLADVVLRRTDIASGDDPGAEALGIAANLAGAELGWNEARVRDEVAEVGRFYTHRRWGSTAPPARPPAADGAIAVATPWAAGAVPEFEPLTGQMEPFDSFWEAPEDVEKGYGKFEQFYRANYLPHVTRNRDANILVISCGPGYFLRLLVREGYSRVWGIDSDPAKIETALAKGLPCETALAFPFLAARSEAYDLIIAEQEINHLTKEEALAFLRLAHASLRPGGELVIHSLNAGNPLTGAEQGAQNFDHYAMYTEYSLRQVLEHSGFRGTRVFPLNLYVFYRNPLNYVGLTITALLELTWRALFVIYGKSNKLWTKKIGAVATKPLAPGGPAQPFGVHADGTASASPLAPVLRRAPVWIMHTVRAVVTFALLALLLRIVNLREVARLLISENPVLFISAILVALADRAFMIAKWYPLLRVQVDSIPLLTAARAYLASSFAAVFLPTSVGGDVLRAIALGRDRRAIVEVGASVVAERLLGMLSLGILCLIGLIMGWREGVDLGYLLPGTLAAVGASVVAFFLPIAAHRIEVSEGGTGSRLWQRLGGVLSRVGRAHALYHRRSGLLALVGVLSLIEQLFPIVVLWLLSRALGTEVSFGMLMIAAPLTLFVTRLPIAVWGLGVAEVSLVYLLGRFGIPASEALALALAGRIIELIAVLPGAPYWPDLVRGTRAYSRDRQRR